MIFGDHFQAALNTAPAEWIEELGSGPAWTVGSLIPNQYSSTLRVYPPEASAEDWWSEYRHLFEIIASVGERHTSRPGEAWFAVWEGHGFAARSTGIMARGATLDELSQVPRFDRPDRTYYLLSGPMSAVTKLEDPGSKDTVWHQPDLFWPDDHRWFVATDVDFWSLYIGGDRDFIAEIAEVSPTPTEIVTLDYTLESEI